MYFGGSLMFLGGILWHGPNMGMWHDPGRRPPKRKENPPPRERRPATASQLIRFCNDGINQLTLTAVIRSSSSLERGYGYAYRYFEGLYKDRTVDNTVLQDLMDAVARREVASNIKEGTTSNVSGKPWALNATDDEIQRAIGVFVSVLINNSPGDFELNTGVVEYDCLGMNLSAGKKLVVHGKPGKCFGLNAKGTTELVE